MEIAGLKKTATPGQIPGSVKMTDIRWSMSPGTMPKLWRNGYPIIARDITGCRQKRNGSTHAVQTQKPPITGAPAAVKHARMQTWPIRHFVKDS